MIVLNYDDTEIRGSLLLGPKCGIFLVVATNTKGKPPYVFYPPLTL